MSGAKVRLALAAAVFLGWMGWLGYTALVKWRGPVVSRALAAASTHPVRAEVQAGPDGKLLARVKVVEPLRGAEPPAGEEVEVVNLSGADGFTGPGEYLLLLAKDPRTGAYGVVGPPASPGYDPVGKPVVYRWAREVEAQARPLFR